MDKSKEDWMKSKGIVKLEVPITGASPWHTFKEPKEYMAPNGILYSRSILESLSVEELEAIYGKILPT